MLTGYQAETIAYHDSYGEFECCECAENRFRNEGGEAVAQYVPISRYELDEYDAENSRDLSDGYDEEDRHVEDCDCTYGLQCMNCGDDLVEPYADPDCIEKRGEDE